MAQYLSEHPDIFMATPKEPHHYNDDHVHGGFKDPRAYAALFQNTEKKTVGEASVFYLYSRVAVPRIEKECPNARYIVMLRNPLEMAPALHEQHVFSGYETCSEFEQAWNLQGPRRSGALAPPPGTDVQILLYAEVCRQGEQLQRLYTHVPRERVLTIFNEDFRSEPLRVWRDVQAFLGEKDDGRTSFPPVNSAKKRKSKVLQHAKGSAIALRRKFGIPPLGTGLLKRLENWNVKDHKRGALSPEMVTTLRTAFRADIDVLAQLTQRDLSHWLNG